MNILAIHAEGCEWSKLQKWRARINELHHAIARQQFAARHMPRTGLFTAARSCRLAPRAQFVRQQAPAHCILTSKGCCKFGC